MTSLAPRLVASEQLDRWLGVLLAMLLHAMVAWLLWQSLSSPLTRPVQTLSVRMIQPLEQPPVAKPMPVPAAPTPRRPEPVTRVKSPDPRPVSAPPQPPEPAPALQSSTPRTSEPAPPPPAVPAVRSDAEYLHNPAPRYPQASLRHGEEGRAILRVQVGADGNVDQLQLHQSSGYPRLDQAALDAVRSWRFVPARQGGQPVAAIYLVPVNFSLTR